MTQSIMTTTTKDQKAGSSPPENKTPNKQLISKDGRSLIRGHAPGHRDKWMAALQGMLEKWLGFRCRWVVPAFCSSFLLYWLLFAVMWYLLARVNEDEDVLDHDAPPPGHVQSVKMVTRFAEAILFALKPQLTIGYDTMYPNAKSPVGISLLALQMLLGLMLETFITGGLVAKFSLRMETAETEMQE